MSDWICFRDGLDIESCDKIIKLTKDDDILVRTNEQWIYDTIWKFMIQANTETEWGYDIKSAESMQISRYKKGKYSDWHSDCTTDSHNSKGDRVEEQVRKLVMIIPLNDDFEGGEFQFIKYENRGFYLEVSDCEAPLNKVETVTHKTGSAIVFPSDMWHRVKPITKGIRYSLTVWFLGPPFI